MTTEARVHNPKGEGDVLRAQLVAAACQLLLAPREAAAPSLRAVARACRVSPTAVYLHFDSQRELIAAVVEKLLAELAQHLSDADTEGDPVESRMVKRAQAYVEWGIAHAGAYGLIFESTGELDAYSPDGIGSQLIGQNTALICELTGMPDREAVDWAIRIWVAIHGLTSLRIHQPAGVWRTTAEHAATEIIALHVAALKT